MATQPDRLRWCKTSADLCDFAAVQTAVTDSAVKLTQSTDTEAASSEATDSVRSVACLPLNRVSTTPGI